MVYKYEQAVIYSAVHVMVLDALVPHPSTNTMAA